MFSQLISHFITYYLIPLTFLWFLGWGRFKSRQDWMVTAFMVSAYMVHIFITGRWDWVWYPFRWVWMGAWVAVLGIGFWRIRALPSRLPLSPQRKFLYGLQGFISFFLLIFLYLGIKGQFYTGAGLHLQFPLRQGTFYVAQGGNSAIINYHHLAEPAAYALDINRLGPPYRRAESIMPNRLEQFYIEDDSVFSPCDGVVFQAEIHAPDMPLGEVDTARFVGNFVGIRTAEGYNVVLAHFKKNSVVVTVGDTVKTGQFLGRVGHSGVVDEPMLHIHAEISDSLKILTGQGVAIFFEEGRFLTRNSIIKR